MRKTMRGAGISTAALACILMTGAAAQAAPADGHAEFAAKAANSDSDWGKSYNKCRNYVKVWQKSGKIKARGYMKCQKNVTILRPSAALSSYRKGKLQDYTHADPKGCNLGKTCWTNTVTMKAKKGLKYHATNSGDASTGVPGEGDIAWPTSSVARVWLTAK
ncbi:hypothetical protein DSC45_30835 [Streptomyces sp. YIM 130001]|uniref:hypothetical protein n=1 Tax=Streptomyces sp. YIM 130001 TaxID=2259644 RepID=UPI000E65139B|nr:hypothetical protein [Streptomyces sp. YIM 130001]RII09478.1 hypothetical protein DSC45_30835 [Streptomyces sp. YIM 130001]